MGVTTPVALAVGSSSDVGRVRHANEDSVFAQETIFVVADGMGGHAAGEVASSIAVDHLAHLAGRMDITTDELLAAIDAANAAIVSRSRRDPATLGMGTTVTGLCLGAVGGSPHWYVFNIGDSRVYRIADGVAEQLTVDHSEVGELLAAGRISPSQAAAHPLRNVVTRSLGTEPSPAADLRVLPVKSGDVFVVCSDGLTNEVSDEEIAAVFDRYPTAQEATDALVALALAAGGHDNVSVIVVSASTPVTASAATTGSDETTAPRLRLQDIFDE